MNELTNRYQGFLVGQLLAGFIALVMVLFGDFGGYYYQTSAWESSGTVSLGSGILATVLVLVLGAGLALALYATISNLQAKDGSVEIFVRNTDRTTRGALFTVGVAALGAAIFVTLNFDSTYWWFDMGFYGAIIGGSLVAYLSKLVGQDIAEE